MERNAGHGMHGIVFDLDETLIDRRAAVEKFAHALWSEYFQGSSEPQPQPQSQAQAQFVIDVIAKDQNGYLARPRFFAAVFQSYSKHVPSQKVIEDLFFDLIWTTPIVVEGVMDAN